MAVHGLNLIIHRGWHDELMQALGMAAALASTGKPVRMLFSGWALERLGQGRIGEVLLDPAHRERTGWYRSRLRLGERDEEMAATLESIKSLGDVRIFACSASTALYGLSLEQLRPWIDEITGSTHFLLEEVVEGPVLYI